MGPDCPRGCRNSALWACLAFQTPKGQAGRIIRAPSETERLWGPAPATGQLRPPKPSPAARKHKPGAENRDRNQGPSVAGWRTLRLRRHRRGLQLVAQPPDQAEARLDGISVVRTNRPSTPTRRTLAAQEHDLSIHAGSRCAATCPAKNGAGTCLLAVPEWTCAGVAPSFEDEALRRHPAKRPNAPESGLHPDHP